MQPVLDGKRLRGPRPSRPSAEEQGCAQEAGGRDTCQYGRTLTHGTSRCPTGQSVPFQCSQRDRHPADPASQLVPKTAAGNKTDSFHMGSHRTWACEGTHRANSLEHHRSWPCSHLRPASRVSNPALADAAKAAMNLSTHGDSEYGEHCGYPHARYNEDFGRSKSGVIQEILTSARSVLRATNVVASGCSEAFLAGTQQWLHSGEGFKEESWSSPVRVDPPSPRYTCDESPFFCKELPGRVYSPYKRKQEDMTSSSLPCDTPAPVAAEVHSCAGFDVDKLCEERGSSVPYLCTMHSTACSSEMLDPALQLRGDDDSFTKETSDSPFASMRRGSSGVQGVWPRAVISSTCTSFTRSGCSSISTTACGLSQRQSVDSKSKGLDPSVSCSFDIASDNVASQTQPSKSQSMPASLQRASVAEKQAVPSTSYSVAPGNAGALSGSPASGFRNAISAKRILPNAPENSHNDFAEGMGPTPPTTKIPQAASRATHSADSAASNKLPNADVRGFVAADLNASDIILSCGLPPPESSAPVSLACRVLIRRYAAAAATAAEGTTPRAAGGRRGGRGEGGKGSPLDTHGEKSKRCVPCGQFDDCGWAWQEDGGGLLLLRLQRKKLDQGKVKSSGYEAFGREYGLPAGRSVNNFAPWNFLYPQVSTPVQKDAFRSIVTDIRRHFASSLSSHVAPSSARGTRVLKHPSAKPRTMQSEETGLTPPLCGHSPSNGISPPASNGFLKSESNADGTTRDGACGWSLKERTVWGDREKGGIKDDMFGRVWSSDSQSDLVEARSCHCCGDRREKLVCCTRSASLLEAKGVAGTVGSAAVILYAAQQPSCEGVRGRGTSLCHREDQVQCETAKLNKQKYLVSSAASRHTGKRHSTCEGRLEGWHAQQLSVRVILRNIEPSAAAPLIREDSPARRRLRKKVTFSVDCFSSDGETTPGVLCRLSPRVQQETPLRQPLISRVHNSTYRQASGLLSRSRTDCPSIVAAAAPVVAEGREAAEMVAGAREEKRRDTGPPTQVDGRKNTGKFGDVVGSHEPRKGICSSSTGSSRGSQRVPTCASAAAVPNEDAIVREESFYILVGCRRPTAASRWTRRGRTVVSRNCTRYVGPLLPLVVSLLERERESVRVRCVDEKVQTKEDGTAKAEQLTKESPFPWRRRPASMTDLSQQHQLKHPHQQRQQVLLQRQTLKEPQQRVPQQRRPVHPCVQRLPQPQDQQHMHPKPQGQRELRQPQHPSGGDEQKQEQATAVRRPAAGEIAHTLPRQDWEQMRNEERHNDGWGARQRDCILYQAPRAPWSHVCPRYYHPLDTPETLFPQARARQLRRLLMLENASGFPAVDNPLVLTNGLPLLQGGGAAAGALGKGNLAAYQQLGPCSVAARAVAMAAATRRPAVPPQLSSTLGHQHSLRERFFSSPYSLPESTATAQGHLFHASAGMGGSAGASPGVWYRRGGVGPVGPPRQAASCSFAFEHSSMKRGFDGEDMRLSGRKITREFEREQGYMEAGDDDDDEEEYPRKRLPRFFRLRRSSDAAGQGGTEERSRLSRFCSLSTIHQHGRNGGSKIPTSERLKRLLVPLFVRGLCSAADTQGQAEGRSEEEEEEEDEEEEEEEEEGSEEVVVCSAPSEQAAELSEDDNEDLWVTESDASTPPLSQASVIVVRKKTREMNEQQVEETAACDGKGETNGKAPRKSATAGLESVSSQQQRSRETVKRVELRRRQPQALEYMKVTEEPIEQWQTQGRKILMSKVHRSAHRQKGDRQAQEGETEVAASGPMPKENSCGSGGEVVQQQREQLTQFHQQQSHMQLRTQHPSEHAKQREQSRCQLQQCGGEQREAGRQMQEHGGSEIKEQQALKQPAPTAEEKTPSAKWLRPLHEESLRQQDHQAREQQHPEPIPQQIQQQQSELLPVAGEILTKKSKPEQQGQTKQAQNRTARRSEARQQQRTEEDTGLSDTLEQLRGMQNQREQVKRRTEALDVCDEGDVVDGKSQAISKSSTTSKQLPCTCDVGTDTNFARRTADPGICVQPRNKQQGVVQVDAGVHPKCTQNVNPARRVCVSEEKAVQEACAPQSALQGRPSAPPKVLAIECRSPRTEKNSVEGSNSNMEEKWEVGHGVLRAEIKRDGLEECKGATYQTTFQDVRATCPAEEEIDGQEHEEEGGLGGPCCMNSSELPVPARCPAMVSTLAKEEVAAEAATVENALGTSLLTRRGFLPSSLHSAEARRTSAQDNARRRTGGGLRWRWKRSSVRARDQKAVGSEDYLSSPVAAQGFFPHKSESPAPVAVSTAAVSAAAASPRAAASAAATITLRNDDQVANSTAAGHQQTVISSLHRWRGPSKKHSLLTAFDQTPAPWPTRSMHGNREESRNLPTLLQRLSTRFRLRRDFGTNKPAEEATQCTSDTA